jgi:malonate-semialdehyde dehydrogenase (acetylating)/methylmalonate-semialdehyde dehydrogenase
MTIDATQSSQFCGREERSSSSTRTLPVTAPATGQSDRGATLCGAAELDVAVAKAVEAQEELGTKPVNERVQVLYRLKALIESQVEQLAKICSRENGKTTAEAKARIARAVECVEFASSLPQLIAGCVLEVSRGVECKMVRYPLGVVAGITPFNFPFMVPLWMVPMAIGCGNAFILKPSEQTPLSAIEIARLLGEAGCLRAFSR